MMHALPLCEIPAMRYLFRIFLFFIFFSGQALGQMSIVLEDETGQGFKLIINDYLQNNPAARKLVLRQIPVARHQVQIVTSEGISARRQLDLKEPGIYRYVVTTNFKGQLQLRYRGQLQSLPAGYPRQDYSQLIAYEEGKNSRSQKRQAKRLAKAQKQDQAEKAAKSSSRSPEVSSAEPGESSEAQQVEKNPSKEDPSKKTAKAAPSPSTRDSLPEKAQTEAASASSDPQRQRNQARSSRDEAELAKKSLPAKEQKEEKSHLASRPKKSPKKAKKDSLKPEKRKEATPSDSKPRPENSEREITTEKDSMEGAGATIIAEIEALEYEFEKLEKALQWGKSAELEQEKITKVLKALRYDQSRIEFLNEVLAQKPAWRGKLPDWLPLMDYQQSRKTLKERWNGE